MSAATMDHARWAAGCTVSQLHRWCELGLIPGQPPRIGSGYRRRWTDDQILVLAVLAAGSETLTERGLAAIARWLPTADWTAPGWVKTAPHVAAYVDLPGIAADVASRRAA